MSLVLTRTQNIRPQSNLDKYELRASNYGALDFFLQDSMAEDGILSQELKDKFFSAIHSTVEVPVIDFDGGISLGSSRAITVSDSENTSKLQTVTSTIYSWGFKMYPTAFMNNEIGYQRDFERKMWKYIRLLASTIDSACATSLNTTRTQVFANALSYGDPTVTDTVLVDLAKELRVLREVGAMMNANDYFNDIHVIGNGGLQSIVDRTYQFGKFNEENKALGVIDKTFHYTNRIADDSGYGATFYAVNKGSVGILSQVDREALNRTRSKDKGREWDTVRLPVLDLEVGTMYYHEDGDYNAIAGAATADMTSSHAECFGFSVNIGIVPPYNSAPTTRANPIMKFAVANS